MMPELTQTRVQLMLLAGDNAKLDVAAIYRPSDHTKGHQHGATADNYYQ